MARTEEDAPASESIPEPATGTPAGPSTADAPSTAGASSAIGTEVANVWPEAHSGEMAVAAHRRGVAVKISAAAIILVALFLLSFVLGRYSGISITDVTKVLANNILPFLNFDVETNVNTVVMYIRLPRILAAVLVGAMLSLAGTAYQSIFRNPLVSPDILGASAGASLGAAIAIFTGMPSVWVQIFAFAFALLAIGLTYLVSGRVKRDPVLALILAGMVIAALANAFVSLLKFVADPNDKLPAITYWLLGSLANVSSKDLIWVIVPMAIGAIPLFVQRWKLNVLSLGDDEAKALGVETKALRRIVILCATLVTAASISIAGLVGWVGLIIPHFCRMLVGSDNRYLLPASTIVGGAFLLLVDNVARSMLSIEIPLGVLTAIIGAPLFITMIMRKGA